MPAGDAATRWRLDRFIYWFFRWMPRVTLSRFVGWSAQSGLPLAHRLAIRAFAGLYGVALEEAERHWSDYATLAEFFVRGLKPGARPIEEAEHLVLSPTDSTLVALGVADGTQLVQAKGLKYDVGKLLGSEEMGRAFRNGTFLTLYLRPRDYHRVHAPVSGLVREVRHIPGDRFPVVPTAVRRRQELYVRNERVAVVLESALGMVAVVMVASVGVGNMSLSWGPRRRVLLGRGRRRDKGPVRLVDFEGHELAQGQELGMFHLGSTVVLLFQEGRVALRRLREGDRVLVGQVIGEAL